MIINSPRNGTIGKDGLTPHIGENGNWCLGDTDTGISASSKSATTIQTIALLATAWVDGTQTVVCSGASADATSQTVTVAADIASKKAYADAGVICTEVGIDELTFTADIAPSVDLVVYVAIEQAGGTVASGPSSDAYSTEEAVVGTWFDGKPVYRKTFVGLTIPGSSEQNIVSVQDLSMDTIVTIRAMWINKNGDVNAGPNSHLNLWYRPSNGHIMSYCTNNNFHGCALTLFLEYTKTTDVATVDIPSATALMDAYDEGVNEA